MRFSASETFMTAPSNEKFQSSWTIHPRDSREHDVWGPKARRDVLEREASVVQAAGVARKKKARLTGNREPQCAHSFGKWPLEPWREEHGAQWVALLDSSFGVLVGHRAGRSRPWRAGLLHSGQRLGRLSWHTLQRRRGLWVILRDVFPFCSWATAGCGCVELAALFFVVHEFREAKKVRPGLGIVVCTDSTERVAGGSESKPPARGWRREF